MIGGNEFEVPLPPESQALTGMQLHRALDQTMHMCVNSATHMLVMVGDPTHECDIDSFEHALDFEGDAFRLFQEHANLFDVNVFLAFEHTMNMVLISMRKAYIKIGFLPDEGETT